MQTTGPFKKIGIISRPRRSNLPAVVPPLIDWLKARKLEIYYDMESAGVLPDPSKGLSREEVADKSELLLVLGGDGTRRRCESRRAARHSDSSDQHGEPRLSHEL